MVEWILSDSVNPSGYISTLRNNVRSRAWGAAIGCSYRVDRCCIVKVKLFLTKFINCTFLQSIQYTWTACFLMELLSSVALF